MRLGYAAAWLYGVMVGLPRFVPLEYVMGELSISRQQAYAETEGVYVDGL